MNEAEKYAGEREFGAALLSVRNVPQRTVCAPRWHFHFMQTAWVMHSLANKDHFMKRLLFVRSALLLLTIVAGAAWAHMAGAQTVVRLGFLPDAIASYATAVSADGSTVVGTSSNNDGSEAFVWTAATGMVGLGGRPDLVIHDFGHFVTPGFLLSSVANAVSDNGSTVVGTNSYIFYDDFGNVWAFVNRAFVWTAATGMVELGHVQGNGASDSGNSWANGVSADGSMVVGASNSATFSGGSKAFVWTAAAGMVELAQLPNGVDSYATAISADGSTVVGGKAHFEGNAEAFVWTATTGLVTLGTLPGTSSAGATGVSADGSTVVGTSGNNDGSLTEAFVWTASTGMLGLGTLTGDSFSFATGVSGDGSTVVGESTDAQHSGQSFIWTADAGMAGLGNLPDGFGFWAAGVSADGSILVGRSGTALGYAEAVLVSGSADPASLLVNLIDDVAAINLANGIANSLDAKLNNALDALMADNADQRQDAVHKLEAFIQAVESQRGNKISEDDANHLIDSATVIINKLNA